MIPSPARDHGARPRPGTRTLVRSLLLMGASVALASCGPGQPAVPASAHASTPARSPATSVGRSNTTTPGTGTAAGSSSQRASALGSPLPTPAALAPFSGSAVAGQGAWSPAGRPVHGVRAVYETTLVPPGSGQRAGISWMDTHLLSARLYSGSKSPGGGPYRYTAPVEPAQAASLVAAFNGGFTMDTAGGGYYTESRIVVPLRRGAASLVIHANGSVNVGAWGSDVVMTPDVVSVRQNLVPLVAGGRPTQAASTDWQAWGSTCGATSCAAAVPGIEHQWRSGVGITADGALVYATGPALDPLQLAQLLVRAGAVRGMQLDINPSWTVFVTYDPRPAGGLATPSNGRKLLASTMQGPWTFFEAWWARDFVTMSARPAG
jgi:hypothetical protein